MKSLLLSTELDTANKTIEGLTRRIAFMEKTLSNSKGQEQMALEQMKEAQDDSNSHAEHVEELEQRLEQVLTRWKLEKEQKSEENMRYLKMVALNNQLKVHNDKLVDENDRLNKRMEQYDHLPLPNEIELRFQHFELDITRLTAELQNLDNTLHVNEEEKLTILNNYNNANSLLQQKEEEYNYLASEYESFTKTMSQLKRDNKHLLEEHNKNTALINTMTKEIEIYADNETKMRRQVH